MLTIALLELLVPLSFLLLMVLKNTATFFPSATSLAWKYKFIRSTYAVIESVLGSNSVNLPIVIVAIEIPLLVANVVSSPNTTSSMINDHKSILQNQATTTNGYMGKE